MYQQRSGGNSGNGNRFSNDRRNDSGSRGARNFSSGPRRFNSRSPKKRGENIDVNKFVQKAAVIAPEAVVQIQHTFKDFGFGPELSTNLDKREYATPTPIQDQSIAHIMKGRDLIGLANTGTGKTAAFLLPLIDKVFSNKYEKVLIIAPTRELAIQIDDELRQFSWGMRLFSAVCVGGTPMHKQINNLRRNPNFVIGTPGRLKDLSERKLVRFETFSNIVLDEVDRMLDMGFVDEISAILNQMKKQRQSLFFSATLPLKIRNLVNQFMSDPITIEIKSRQTAENVDQDIIKVRDKAEKFDRLQTLLNQPDLKKVLIFTETKWETEKLAVNLCDRGFRAESIHGDKRQNQRQKSLAMFKNDHANILVATDVAARGLDIDDISHVINYTIPQTYNDYIHRIGRTGRGDKAGKALTFVE